MITIFLNIGFDPSAIKANDYLLTVFGYVVVFIALALIAAFFTNLPKLLKLMSKAKTKYQDMKDAKLDKPQIQHIPGEVNAAIAMALHLYFDDPHDEESTEFTIKRVSRNYSPWNSKIYNMDEYRKIRK